MKRLLLLALTACATPVDVPVPDAGPLCAEWALPAPVGTLQSEELIETSGLAASRLHAGVLYAHNDSGSDAVLFALHPDGSTAGRFAVEGVDNRDWEAMAAGPCPGKAGHCFVLGDAGVNAKDAPLLFGDPRLIQHGTDRRHHRFAARQQGARQGLPVGQQFPCLFRFDDVGISSGQGITFSI